MKIQLSRYMCSTPMAKILLCLTVIACWVHLLFFPMHMQTMPNHALFNVPYLIGWTIMVIAMMGGFLFSAYTYIGNNAPPRTQIISIILYTLMWLLIWAGVGEAFSFIPSLIQKRYRLLITGCIFIAAGLWNITKWKQKALRDCHSKQPVDLTGIPFYTSMALCGARQGWTCVQTCWLMMVVMMIVPAHTISMITLTVIGLIERITSHPRKTAHAIAAIFSIIGVGIIIATINREGISYIH